MDFSPVELNNIINITKPPETQVFLVKAYFDFEHIRAGCNINFIQAVKDAGFGGKEYKLRTLRIARESNLGIVCFIVPPSAMSKLPHVVNCVNASFCKTNAIRTPYHSIATHKMTNGVVAPDATEIVFYHSGVTREQVYTTPMKSTPTMPSLHAVRKVIKARSRTDNESLLVTPVQIKKPCLAPCQPQKRARFLYSNSDDIDGYDSD